MKSEVHNPKVSICNGIRPISSRSSRVLERLLFVVNKNNANPTCSLLGLEPIRSVVIIRPNLIGYYLVEPNIY